MSDLVISKDGHRNERAECDKFINEDEKDGEFIWDRFPMDWPGSAQRHKHASIVFQPARLRKYFAKL